MEEVFNNNNSTTKTSNREVNLEIMVIDDGEEPSKSKSESETIIKVEELFTPRIPRVPLVMRNLENNKGMFDPKVVSIGPYHHGKEDLQLVENVKPMVAKLFLQDSGKNMDEVYSMILEKVVDDARSCYVKRSTDKYSPEQFATMMLLDGCFILAIIEDFSPYFVNRNSKYDDVRDHLGLLHWLPIYFDIFYLLENQLPFQVLELLMSLKFKEDEGMKSINMLLNFLISLDSTHLQNKEKVNVNETDSELFHLLQLLHKEYLIKNALESRMSTEEDYTLSPELVRSFRSVTELKAKGIYSMCNSSLSRVAAEFKSFSFYGRLELNPFVVDLTTKLFFSNMVVYEMVSNTRFGDCPITSYIDFMKSLIDNQDDVKELRSKHILLNNLGSDQEVANVFKEITTFGSRIDTYRVVMKRIQHHYNSTTKTWMAEFINKYFSGPWTAIAFFAATCLFVLAFLQTYYTISPPHSSHK